MSGAPTVGHNALRNTLANILRDFDYSVRLEQSPQPDRADVPADILLATSPNGKSLAVDISVATPFTRNPSDRSALDVRITAKRYLELCRAQQWVTPRLLPTPWVHLALRRALF